MGAAYSDDLRKKALEAIARGERPSTVAQLLGISRNTLNLWRQRHAQSGSYAPKRGYQRGHNAKITDWEEFRAFAHPHGGKTLAEMAALRGVGYMTISRGLQKIGFTRKKRATAIGNATMPRVTPSSRTSPPSTRSAYCIWTKRASMTMKTIRGAGVPRGNASGRSSRATAASASA